ncbi:MAG: DUF4339 domain-containing protein [Verrucomicrobiales bacterium]|nr:DUF4339 domain-containing protein [Verrucomicrobiales bacterium]
MNYWISQGDCPQGPYSWEQVVAMRRNGTLTDSDHLWGESWPEWQSLRVTAEEGGTNWLHIGSTFRNDQNGKSLAAKNPAHLHIQVFDGRLRATVDGEQMQEVAVGKSTRGLHRAGQIGFGGGQAGGGSEVRYSHWKIRVMPSDETPR